MRFITLADLITRLYIRKRAINRITVTAEVMMIEEKQLNCDLTWTAVYECYKQDFTIPLNPLCQLITMSNSNCILLPPKCDLIDVKPKGYYIDARQIDYIVIILLDVSHAIHLMTVVPLLLHLICCLWWLMWQFACWLQPVLHTIY